jgi:hypothetical protein
MEQLVKMSERLDTVSERTRPSSDRLVVEVLSKEHGK